MGDKHQVRFEPVDIEIEVDEDETILDAAFRQGVMLMHGCKEGQCSACKSFLLDGDLQMERYSTFALADYESEEGYVLLCRGHAYSDLEVELINYDEDMIRAGVPIQLVNTEVAVIEELTHDIVHLRLTFVSPRELAFNPGQYADVRIPGTEHWRSFSMANTPSTDHQADFVIRRYLAAGELGGLRRVFLRKGYVAAQERMCAGLADPDVRLGDVPDSPAKETFLLRRAELGLDCAPDAYVLADPDGEHVPAGRAARYLRFARTVRISMESNEEYCRGLLRIRYEEKR